MNRILKLWQPAMLAVFALAFNACTDEYEYTPQPDADYEGAYILADETTLILGEDDAQQLSFTVARHDSTEAATYKLYTTNSSVNVPTEVNFAANEGTKKFTIDFDFPIGTIEENVTIGVEEGDTYMYGAHSQTYTISRCKKIPGQTTMASYFFSDGQGGPGTWLLDIYEYGTLTDEETGVKTARYLLKEPFAVMEQVGQGYGTGYNVIFSLDSNGNATTAEQGLYYDTYNGGEVVVSGNGTYYSNYNAIVFIWTLRIPSLGGGFGSIEHDIYFPTGYNPIPQ